MSSSAFGFGADRLGWTDEALDELRRLRGWTEPAIERLGLTYDARTGVVGIPIRDETLTELGTLRYLPTRRNGRAKMTGPAGVERQLFPPPETLGDDVDEVIIGEGEPDTAAAASHGFAVVGVPGTAGWRDEYAARFSGRRWRVYVAFDCDEPGRKAARNVAASLAAAGVDARIVDLDPARRDGYDLTDYLLEQGAGAMRELMAAAEFYTGDEPTVRIVFEPLRDFLARELPPAESLVGVTRNGTNLLPRYGWVMPWGPAGSGKTSVLVDMLYHVAAGIDWLGWPVARALRLVVVVNEGIPGGFQDKLAAKLEAWPGDHDAVLDNLAVYASPWGEFQLSDLRMREHARSFALDFGADYVALDPLHTLGTIGAGTPEETETFKHVLRAFGVWADLGVLTAHHSNKAGMVSGDWTRHPDTVIHLEKDGKAPATKLTLEKARPADPAELGVPVLLEWVVDSLGYRRVELNADGPQLSDDDLLAEVVDALDGNAEPASMTDVLEALGHDHHRVRAVVKNALSARGTGVLRNLATRKGRYALVVGGTADTDSTDNLVTGEQTRMETRPDVGGSAPPTTAGGSASAETGSGALSSSVDPWTLEGSTDTDNATDGDDHEEGEWTF